jgi:hypothetical protein
MGIILADPAEPGKRLRCRLPQRCNIRVDRTALRHLLLEVQDLRARQGVDWTWTDRLHPTLARELDAAIRDEAQ